MFLKILAPLFENGVDAVDWNASEDQLSKALQQFFKETDWTNFSK